MESITRQFIGSKWGQRPAARQPWHYRTFNWVLTFAMSGALLFCPPIAGAQTAGDVAREVLADSDYQGALPKHAPGERMSPSSDSAPWIPAPKMTPRIATGVGHLFEVLLYLALGILLLSIIILWIRSRSAEKQLGATGEPEIVEAFAVEIEHDKVLESAEMLARAGRYSEAVHVLLLRAIDQVRKRATVSDALTARELSRTARMEPAVHTAFDVLVRVSELGYFGGRTLGADDYAQCAEGFAVFRGQY